MKKVTVLFLVVVGLILTACGSTSDDVPSLAPTPTPETADEALSNEEMMLEFTACLREMGLEVADPVVDANGNVGKPEILSSTGKEDLSEAYEACGYLLEGFTFEDKQADRSEELEYYLELAACLREEGIEVGDPTAETLDTWMGDFKTAVNFDDPDSVEAYETCTGEDISAGGGKGK